MDDPILLQIARRIYDWEPLSPEASRSLRDSSCIEESQIEENWAMCDGYKVLCGELARYCEGRFRGQSFLVAGHRGSGKTLLTHLAIQIMRLRFQKQYRNEQAASSGSTLKAIPFHVPIHGPDLLAGWNPSADGTTSTDFAKHAMGQILLALQKSFKDEILHQFEQMQPPVDASILAELSRDLLSSQTASELARIWSRLNLIDSGILGARFPGASQGSGRSEILMLEALNHAASRLESSPQDAITLNAGTNNSFKFDVRQIKAYWNLVAPILSVGVAIFAATQIAKSAPTQFPWLIPGIAFFITLALTRKFLTYGAFGPPDGGMLSRNSLPDLDRALPAFVSRLHQSGYAPIFVVDELDKVADMEKCMAIFMKQLKYFATDEAFFCFLTDRKYLEVFQASLEQHTYPEEQTYFGHRILVHYTFDQIGKYIRSIIQGEEAKHPHELHFARMLAIFESHCQADEADRFIITNQVKDNWAFYFSVEQPGIWSSAAYRLHGYFLLAIMVLFESRQVRQRLRQNRQFGAWLVDTYYWICQEWKLSQEGSPQLLTKYGLETSFASLLQIDRRGPVFISDILSEDELNFLWTQAKELQKFLTTPSFLFFKLLSDFRLEKDSGEWVYNLTLAGLAAPILLSAARADSQKSEVNANALPFDWNFTFWGRGLSRSSKDWSQLVANQNHAEVLSTPFRECALVIEIIKECSSGNNKDTIQERALWLLQHLFERNQADSLQAKLFSNEESLAKLANLGICGTNWSALVFSNLFHYCSKQKDRAYLLPFLLRNENTSFDGLRKDSQDALRETQQFLLKDQSSRANEDFEQLKSGGAFDDCLEALKTIWATRNTANSAE